jgi:hypothetical protein
MTCAAIMTTNPVTVSETDAIGKGADLREPVTATRVITGKDP